VNDDQAAASGHAPEPRHRRTALTRYALSTRAGREILLTAKATFLDVAWPRRVNWQTPTEFQSRHMAE
jgi:hypothetical protein